MAKLRAFVVEDSPVILENLIQTIEEIVGVEVVASAQDEQSALAWMDARTDGCDVVIIDVFLRSGSGLGVLEGMMSYTSPPGRIVLTNYATADIRSRCQALGAEVVFDKSHEIEDLLRWLAKQARSIH